MKAQKTVGFGVPDVMDPHRFVLVLPRSKIGDVTFREDYGVDRSTIGATDRFSIRRDTWALVQDEVRRELNARLKAKGFNASRWFVGDNPIERVLGRELCVLGWALEASPASLAPVALASWLALVPEERWWLFAMADRSQAQFDRGWRKAIRIALTEVGGREPEARKKGSKAVPGIEQFRLPGLIESRVH